jgi:hypothetical protein
MLGLVLTLVAAATPVHPANGEACVDGPFCEAADASVAPLAFEPRAYATPAVIDCRSPHMPLLLATLVGECDGTPRDLSYLVSRSTDGEQRTLALRPARHEQRGHVSSCDGLPPKGADLVMSDAHPLAVYATVDDVRVAGRVLYARDVFSLASRFNDPPEKPPRV